MKVITNKAFYRCNDGVIRQPISQGPSLYECTVFDNDGKRNPRSEWMGELTLKAFIVERVKPKNSCTLQEFLQN